MAEYKGIKGFKVQTVSTDPAASIVATGSWASGGNLNAGRTVSGFGTQTAAIAAGGFDYPPNVNTAAVESYNGTAWTEVNDLNTARRETGEAGTQPAGLVFGGIGTYAPTGGAINESWDGTNWTEVAD
jgi:hypothetical protein